jgi:hypothetical protein
MADPTTSTTPLPPFSGDTPACSKCGHASALTTYRKKGDARVLDVLAVPVKARVERLERRCARCWFTWDEAIVDTSCSPAAGETVPNNLEQQ